MGLYTFSQYEELRYKIIEKALRKNDFESAYNTVNTCGILSKREILELFNKSEQELKSESYLFYLKEIKQKYDSLLYQVTKIEENKAYDKLKTVLDLD